MAEHHELHFTPNKSFAVSNRDSMSKTMEYLCGARTLVGLCNICDLPPYSSLCTRSRLESAPSSTMPTDQHGVTHAGALGLYDDADEKVAADQRLERHQRERLGTMIRRERRRAGRRRRKEIKATKCEAKGRSVLLRPESWLEKALHRERHSSTVASLLKLGEEDGTDDGRKPAKGQIRAKTEYVVVRKPATLEPAYTAEDIDLVNSPWLRECGMVRVKSHDSGGCHIVPKNSILKND